MWGGNPISKRWGESGNIALNDGLNQNNHIAVFPTKVQGAAAQFDLWRSRYCGMTLQEAVTKWSGGNSSPAYMHFLCERTGLSPSSPIMPSVLWGTMGLNLMKAQAAWESGRIKEGYPMSDAEWVQAQHLVFPNAAAPPPPEPSSPTPEVAPVPKPKTLWGLFVSAIKRFRNA